MEVLALIVNHAFDAISVVGIIGALLISARQNSLTSRAIQSQSFVNLFDLEIQSGFQEGIRAITALPTYNSYSDFVARETTATQEAIYNAVTFLNFMAVLGEEGYLHIQDAWDVYFWSYRRCAEKLLPWWLAAQRVSQPNVFPSFERACLVISVISPELIAAFDKKIGIKYLDKYQKASRVSRSKLRTVLSRQLAS